jgi:hypothetical protein
MLVLLIRSNFDYAVEMASGTMIYIPRFIKTGSSNQELMRGNTHIHTDSKLIS